MGTFKVPISIANVNGGEARQVEALVDTGATKSRAPESLLYELSIRPYDTDVVELGNGSLEKWAVCTAAITYQDKKAECPVWVGPPVLVTPSDASVVLGATALEMLGFKVDPVNETLESVPLRG